MKLEMILPFQRPYQSSGGLTIKSGLRRSLYNKSSICFFTYANYGFSIQCGVLETGVAPRTRSIENSIVLFERSQYSSKRMSRNSQTTKIDLSIDSIALRIPSVVLAWYTADSSYFLIQFLTLGGWQSQTWHSSDNLSQRERYTTNPFQDYFKPTTVYN